MTDIVNEFVKNRILPNDMLCEMIESSAYDAALFSVADTVRRKVYGTDVYIRGLIEFTNICKNNCYYCGIRAGNLKAERYRLTKEEILACCENGYRLGFRTFVLQGGEDTHYDDKTVCDIVYSIKMKYPDTAVTLSIGEKNADSYRAYFSAGASRYLLRHETATESHYAALHPAFLTLENRKKCLFTLKNIGFQVGSGFMVGSPYQTTEHLVNDLHFLKELDPDMIGIGPFIHHADTPLRDFPSGSVEKTLRLVAISRIMFPHALISATTALATLSPAGRERALSAGANVVMPNLSPSDVRSLYTLYDAKLASGSEAAEALDDLKMRIDSIGYNIVCARGDVKREE